MKHIGIAAVLWVCVTAIGSTAGNDGDLIVHVLNRTAFGPTSADVAHVRAIGVKRYVDEQLQPDTIDDRAAEARLEGLTTLAMSSRELAATAAPALPELAQQKILRGVFSKRQLQEVLVDFWFNHFNVDARKGPDRFLLPEYERDAIRPHVLGKFRDLLGATAHSPAMLFYLDNWLNAADPSADTRAARAKEPFPARTRGINENYARELMELHTLGVDGGYTQKDVAEVARAFTGWSIAQPRQGGEYRFVSRIHDNGEKVVLGHVIPAGGGESDGERVLDILARHPSTARFIATKLVRRFVSDNPPRALVDRAAARFRDTDGDIREVVRAILQSKEFQSRQVFNAKAKTPFEFLASALRAAAPEAINPRAFVRMMQELGMPLYQCQPPTGYADSAEAWINTGALVARMNAAPRLAFGDPQLAVRFGSPEFQRH